MVILKRLFVLLLVLVSCLLAAQESGFFVTKTGEDFQLHQIISFPADHDAARYEVELERIESGRTIPVDKITVETNRIELSLKAGTYRYRITSFNGWDLINGVSEWQGFTVFPAVQPTAETYQPFYGLYYELADPDGALILNGRDFTDESEFALVQYSEEVVDWTGISLQGLKGVMFPEQTAFNDDYTQAVLTFKRKALKRGEYSIFIRNPGGLWTVFGQVRVGYRKNTDWTLSFGWMPMIAAFDYENAYKDLWGWDSATSTSYHIKEQRLDAVNPRAWYFRVGWFPVKTRLGNFGFELTMMSLQDKVRAAEDGKELGDQLSQISGGHFDLVYQLELTERWQGNIRFGMGYGDEYHYNSGELYEEEDETPALINFGISVQYFIWKNLYAEGGIDLQYMTLVDHTMIRPFLGLGWQFGRWAEYAEVTKALDRGEDPSVPVTKIPEDEFTFSLGWSPMVPLFGIDLTSRDYYYYDFVNHTMVYHETTELWPVNPLGAYFRAAYIPYRWGKNKLGAELSFYILNRPGRKEIEEDFYKGLDILSLVHFQALYQRVLTGSWQLNARAGMGISHPYPYSDLDSGTDTPVFSINTGASVQYFFWRNAYAEAGLDFVFSFGDVKHGMLRPGIGIGWQFNRNVPTGFTEDGLRFFRNPPPGADPE
ncbi:MAG: hypothetical protein LBC31_08985 [Treponema sp.]|jgi:hypothetical protein|nr:hypothetical protein [Treponema sp.]